MGGSIASLFVEIGADVKGAQSGFQKVESGLSGLAGKAAGFAGMAATGFGLAVAAPILGGIGSVFGSITDGVMGTNAALQQSGVAWGVLLGGADQAQAKIAELFAFGASTPFEFGEVDKASRVLQTFGGNLLNTTANLTMIGDVASGVGQPFGDVAMWTARMYDAFKSGQPFGEAAARLQEMGAMSGETRLKLEQMQKEGATQEQLWAVLSESFGRYGGMMEKQATTMNGRLGTMKDSLNMVLATAGKPIFDMLSNGLGKFNDLLASPALMAWANKLATGVAGAISTAIGWFGQLASKVGGIVNIGQIIAGAFKSGDFNSAFGPLLAAIDSVFGAGVSGKVAGLVGNLLSGFQVIRDAAITFWQAINGNWGGAGDTRINGTVKLFGILGTAIHTAGQFFITTLLPAAQTAIGWLFSQLPRVGDLLNTIQQAVIGFAMAAIPVLQQIGQYLITGFQTALPYVQQVGTFLVSAFQQAGPMIGQIGTAIMGIVPYLQAIGSSLMGAFNSALPVLQQVATAVGTGIAGAIAVIVPLAQQLFAVFMSQLPAMQGLWTQLQAVWTAAVPILQMLAAVVGGVLVTAWGLMLAALGGAIGFFSGALPGAIMVVSGVLQVVQASFQFFAAFIGGIIGIIVNLVQGDWQGAWEAAKNMVSGMVGAVTTLIGGLKDIVLGLFSALVGGVIGYVSGWASTLNGYFSGLLSSLTGTTVNIKDSIVNGWNALTSAVSTTVGGWVTAVIGFFTNLGSSVGTAATNLQTNVTNAFTNLVSAVTSSVSGFVTAIVGFFTSLWTQAVEKANAIATGVGDAFDNMITGAKTAMGNLSTGVLNALSGLVSGAASGAANIASAIVQGLVNGIANGIGAVADAARNLAKGALDAALGFLGIHSPSREFFAIGTAVVDGFTNGIYAGQGAIVAAVQGAFAPAIAAARQLWAGLQGAMRFDGPSPAAGFVTLGTLSGSGGWESTPGIVKTEPSDSIPGNTKSAQSEINITVHGSVISDRDLQQVIMEAINEAQGRGY